MTTVHYSQVYDYENLYQAYLLAKRHKSNRASVLNFSYNLEENLIQLQNELIWKTYRVGNYHTFTIHEPKERLVSALPFRDRVVQHALCRVIEPVFEHKMISDSFACRTGKGTLAAAQRLSYFMGKESAVYYLKCDIRKYFMSVNISILKRLVSTWYIKDPDILWLLFAIYDADNECDGLKIGNLVSQLSANVYLTELDFFVKTRLQEKFYVRYMDDFIVLHKSKQHLHQLRAIIEEFLGQELKLCLNHKTSIGRARDGIDFVGYRTFRLCRIIKKNSMNRMRGKFNAWRHGKMPDVKYLSMLGSWIGHAKDTASVAYVQSAMLKSLRILCTRAHA